MSTTDVAILGTGMTDMSRRDLEPDLMAYEVVHEALDDAGVSAHELGLVIVGNAMAGRLSDQGCMRGQTWLRKAGLSEAAIINVDNSCAGGSSALHLATMAATVQDRPVLALGRREDVDGRPGRDDRRDRGRPAGGVPPRPARAAPRGRQPGREHPHGPQQRLGPAPHGRDGRDACARSPPPRSRPSTTRRATRWPSSSARVTIDEVLASPQVAGVLTRLMCSSFTDGAAAMVLGGPRRSGTRHRLPVSSVRWPARETARSTTTTG